MERDQGSRTFRRLKRLKSFLEEVEGELDWEFDLDDFGDRVRIQKYVFLAKEFGFDPGYEYNMYLYGPYSRSLAEDYYSEEFDEVEPEGRGLRGFDLSGFSELVTDKSQDWLELAATVLSVHGYHEDRKSGDELRETVVQRASEIKEEEPELVDGLYGTLREKGLVG